MTFPYLDLLPIASQEALEYIPTSKAIQFAYEVNQDIKLLNQWIYVFNTNHDKTKRRAILQGLYQVHQQFRDKYPPWICSQYTGYEAFYNNLLKKIQMARKYYMDHSEPQEDSPLFAEILKEMSQEKVTQMTDLILKSLASNPWNSNCLKKLYSSDEVLYRKFKRFLLNFDLRLISLPANELPNSILFEVKPKGRSHEKSFLFKIEINRKSPFAVEMALRKQLQSNVLTTMYAKRDCSYRRNNNIPHSLSLSLTEYCEQGNILKKSRRQSDRDRIRSAIEIYRQVSQALLDFETANVVFSDLKNSNLLLTRKRLVRVGDAKSLFPSSDGKIFLENFFFKNIHKVRNSEKEARKKRKNRWYEWYCSLGAEPPESRKSVALKPQSVHAYMLGAALYQYLSGCDDNSLQSQLESQTLNFNLPIFNTSKGRKLKRIIQHATKQEPSLRSSMTKIRDNLEAMQLKEQHECQAWLRKIKACSFGGHDKTLALFLDEMQEEIIRAAEKNNVKALKSLAIHLSQIHTNLAPVTDIAKELIEAHKKDANKFFSTKGHKEKARCIEKAMCEVPVEERAALAKGITRRPALKTKKVLDAMGKPRFENSFFSAKPGNASTLKKFKAGIEKQFHMN